jgi:hypothetical protein
MSVKDNPNLGPIATVPDNTDQPPRFGGITELVKDAFVLELRHYFNTSYSQVRPGELPRISKYAVAVDVSVDPLETAVNLIRSYPDVAEDMPIIAVLAATGNNLKLNISDKFVGVVIPPARVLGGQGPFNLTNGTLTVQTIPDGNPSKPVTSTFKFPPTMFVDITNVTLDEIIKVINFQALYVTAGKVTTNGVTTLALSAGGPKGRSYPNSITVLGGSAVTALGFTTNQANQNYGPGKQISTRHMLAADFTVALEVVAESENVRTELSDLLFDFLTFVMSDRQFQFFGRSIFDAGVADETYQIIIKDKDVSIVGEQEMPRPGDPRDKIYVNRINVPVSAIQYTDRVMTTSTGQIIVPPASITLGQNDDLPTPN